MSCFTTRVACVAPCLTFARMVDVHEIGWRTLGRDVVLVLVLVLDDAVGVG